MKEALRLENISLNYHTKEGETKALKDVNFSVKESEFVSIIGPSGSGKSTLLSIISGLLKQSTGKVLFYGKERNDCKVSMGYMLQKDHLFEWRNILKNAVLGLEVQGKLTKESIEDAKKMLDKYGLGKFHKSLARELSGGMRQRAALVRTLLLDPDLLILDEPFSALDYQTRLYVADDIGGIIREEKRTAILVTHDISEAISLSDRVIVLSARPGTVKKIYEIKLSVDERTAMKSREALEFKDYFNAIWKELETSE